MGSLGTAEKKKMVITQVSVGGFDKCDSAEELANFLEDQIGVLWRCRLKNSWTPPESYPKYDVPNTADINRTNDYEMVKPHAFVHFASPEAAKMAHAAAGRSQIIFKQNPLVVNLGPENSFRMNQQRRTIDPFKFPDVSVEIGTLVSGNKFLVGWKGPASGVSFVVDPFDGTCKFLFTKETAFAFKGMAKYAVIKCDFKVEFLVRDITGIKRYNDMSSLVMVFHLASSPHLFYRTADDDFYDSVPFDLLDDDDPWIRTTDFTLGRVVGRCSSYRIRMPPRVGMKLERAMSYLKENRIQIERHTLKLQVLDEPDYLESVSSFFFSIEKKEIPFDIMFLVNAVIHKGIINCHQLSDKFYELLQSQSREVAITALRHICSSRRPVFDAYKKLKDVQEWLLKNPKLLRSSKSSVDNVEVRRLVITPTKAYCLPPELELSNRVLRRYKQAEDRFLRVTFMDEGMQQLNSSVLNYFVPPIARDKLNTFRQKTSVFQRFANILRTGFVLCGRKYSFLAFSANQLRDSSAWFFAEDKSITVSGIKRWMGKFEDRNVAKCAARIGLCFSSTYATVEVPWEEVNPALPDIERNGYVFSDGIGMLTPDLAVEVAEKLQLGVNPPSAYQVRFTGCKGVIACWPGKDDGIRLSMRWSMKKFVSQHNILEIVSWTRFQPGFLNRQIITLLSALGVADDVFAQLQDSMVSKLGQMTENSDIAFDILTTSCTEQGNTAAMMLSAGFEPRTEPHLRGMLSSIKAAQLRDLRTKARIFVHSGRWLMGCLDELGVLENGQCFIQVSTPSLENCFSKQGPAFSKNTKHVTVIKGTVAIAKNPCLHPGDIRLLEAVDVPGLHHLVDCLVFPQNGDRPHANEASGSDLDGDLYFATWDDMLIPPGKKSFLPMDYSPAEAKKLPRPVTSEDIIDFFVRNMVNEKLGTICNAHVVHADMCEKGALDQKCIELAELAATAVDFPKTGIMVIMPQHLKPKVYPDFMGKEDFQSYKSDKILGRLYRKIVDAPPELSTHPKDIPYDTDLEVPGSAEFVTDAWNKKCSYDGQLNALMGQYKVNSEDEVVTGHVWSMPKYNSRKQGELTEKLKHAYHSLKKEFKHEFENLGERGLILTDDEKNSLYEQKASAWYQVTYHPQWVVKSLGLKEPEEEGHGSSSSRAPNLLLSFGWIPVEYLVRMKIRQRGRKDVDMHKPINALAQYLAPRI
ncbi:RNA-directed RNA polymerase [Ranunculus cassubicifolius]